MNESYRYRPVRYFALTFAVTYGLWFVGAFLSFREDQIGWYLLLLGLIAPFLLSLGMIMLSKNPAMKRDFLNRLLNPRLIQLRMLPVMLFLMPITMLVAIGLSLPLGGSVEQFQMAEGFSFSSGFVPVLLLLLMAAVFEELGWRGYAFDSLESRFPFLTASLIFGALWSLWHFPLVFVKDSYQYELIQANPWYAVNFFAGIVLLGVIISWVCVKNRKSVIAAIAFHFVINLSQETLAVTQMTKCIQTGVLAVVVVALVALDRELFFSRDHLADESQENLVLPEAVPASVS